MPVSCQCNGKGTCRGCACKKAGRNCSSCLLLGKGQCVNPFNSSNLVQDIRGQQPTLQWIRDLPNVPLRTSDSLSWHGLLSLSVTREDAILDTDVSSNDRDGLSEDSHVDTSRSLPAFKCMSHSNALWHDLTGQEFSNRIDDIYNQIVYWKPNLFTIPSRNYGKLFVGELARLFESIHYGVSN